jgi:uncharacterized protein
MTASDHAKLRRAYRITVDEGSSAEERALAFRLWRELAEKGYIRSTFYLGVCFDNGIGTRTNRRKAFEAFLRAARDGHPEAQYNLYQMYRRGIGTEKDLRKAIRWLREAAKHRDIEAIRDLGFCYHEGVGVRNNHAKAAELYRTAAKAGDSRAQWSLALCYLDGHGVNQSQRWSMDWMRKAAKNGHDQARAYLARDAQHRAAADVGRLRATMSFNSDFERAFIQRSRELVQTYTGPRDATLLLNCLLGLLVVPKETCLRSIPLDPIEKFAAWGISPEAILQHGTSRSDDDDARMVRGLVWRLRNAVAHFRFRPLPETGEVIAFDFHDQSGFRASIPIGELRVFVERLAKHLEAM